MTRTAIVDLRAREILDSRGHPTIEVEAGLESGARGRGVVPSGASTGAHEARERRDDDPARYGGKGVLGAVRAVEDEIQDAVLGRDALDQAGLDRVLVELDGTPTKERLGANALLGASLAVAHAAAQATGESLYHRIGGIGARVLPVPLMNLLNGGAHADNGLDVQEFMIVPHGATTFAEALRYGSEVFHALAGILSEEGHATGLGDEGGFAPAITGSVQAIELLLRAIEKAGRIPGQEVSIALDAAATEIKDGDVYRLAGEGKELDSNGLGEFWMDLADRYPIVSIEDPFGEDDWSAWSRFTKVLGDRMQIVGDDLFVTHPKRLGRGIVEGAGNALLAKPNQIGTLSETLEAISKARDAGFGAIVSHRSGETEDTTIADIAVGTGCGQIKTGSLARSERLAKYNRLLRIEEELGKWASYPGREVLAGARAGKA